MIINVSKGGCGITFEEGEIHAGKRLKLAGELMKHGFVFGRSQMRWYYVDEKGLGRSHPVDEADKDEIINYVIENSKKLEYWP